jgi:hypothetical protein
VKIIACTTCHWDDAGDVKRPIVSDPILGLRAWYDRVQYLFNPVHTFVACGTYSDPKLSPLGPSVPIVNAGIPVGLPYDHKRRQYWMAAFSAACYYALNRIDWDLLVFLDTDALVGAVNFRSLLSEFQSRQELILTNNWCDTPSGPLIVFKRDGIIRFAHQRIQENCVLSDSSPNLPLLAEHEMKKIFDGVWWNPWPQIDVRQDYPWNPNQDNPMKFLHCPFIRQPHPDVVQEYLNTQWSKAVPV